MTAAPETPRFVLHTQPYSWGLLPNPLTPGSYTLVSTQTEYLDEVFQRRTNGHTIWTPPKYLSFEDAHIVACKLSQLAAEQDNIEPPTVYALVDYGNSEVAAEPFAFKAGMTRFDAYCMKAQRDAISTPKNPEEAAYREECFRRLCIISPKHAALRFDSYSQEAALELFGHDQRERYTHVQFTEDEYYFRLAHIIGPAPHVTQEMINASALQTASSLAMSVIVPQLRAGAVLTPALAREALIGGAGSYAVFLHTYHRMCPRFDDIAMAIMAHSDKYGLAFALAYQDIQQDIQKIDQLVFDGVAAPATPNMPPRPKGRPSNEPPETGPKTK